jgi:hypothetical protein
LAEAPEWRIDHLVFWPFAVMHSLMIALLGSLCGLLLAAAGVARHVWLQRARLREPDQAAVIGTGEDRDLESEL